MSDAPGSDTPSGAAAEAGAQPGEAGPDAVEQLQRAVLTAIGAARVVLDALEVVVADRQRIEQLSATGREALGTLCSLLGGRSHDEPPPAGGETPGDPAETPSPGPDTQEDTKENS